MAIFILLLLMTTCYAKPGGVDFSMHSQYIEDVPDFKSYQDAVAYAKRVKWNERILLRLKEKSKELWDDAYDIDTGWMLMNQKQKGNVHREQWQRVLVALKIIEEYKRKGIRGDPAMGSSFYAGEEPCNTH